MQRVVHVFSEIRKIKWGVRGKRIEKSVKIVISFDLGIRMVEYSIIEQFMFHNLIFIIVLLDTDPRSPVHIDRLFNYNCRL